LCATMTRSIDSWIVSALLFLSIFIKLTIVWPKASPNSSDRSLD
jgi:hypothetical protein